MPLWIDPTPNPARGGFLRASIGQGFRLPSIAELYSNSKIGGVRILGDSTLDAEQSWSAEVGYMHRFGRSELQPELDIAFFIPFIATWWNLILKWPYRRCTMPKIPPGSTTLALAPKKKLPALPKIRSLQTDGCTGSHDTRR